MERNKPGVRVPFSHREGRYKACLVDSHDYPLRCYRYIELNPVRAAMTTAPEDDAWSSYCKKALGADDYPTGPHPVYLALGADTGKRCARYRSFVSEATTPAKTGDIRLHLQSQYASGSR